MELKIYFPGIVGYKNIFDESYKELLKIQNKINWTPMLTGHEDETPILENQTRKGSNISMMSLMNDIDFINFNDNLNKNVADPLLNYSKKYGYWNLIPEGWVLLKYNINDFFDVHTDSSRRYPRQVSSVYYINDDYSGGELEFPYINLSIKPSSGELLIFPSTNLFSHKARPVISGVKYSMANWYN